LRPGQHCHMMRRLPARSTLSWDSHGLY